MNAEIIENEIISAKPNSAETFGFLASPSARSYNRCVCGSLPSVAHLNSAFGGTSHTRRPLYAIVGEGHIR